MIDYTTPDDIPVERKPGDFRRKGIDGPPYVASPTETRKRLGVAVDDREPNGRKPELLAAAAALGIEVPDKVTIDELHDLLGPEPRSVLYGRPSGFGAPLDNPHNLMKWKERQLVEGLLRRSDLLDRGNVIFTGDNADDERDRMLDGIAAAAHEAAETMLAADRGTHVHLLIEWHNRGDDIEPLIARGEALGIPAALQRQIVQQWADFRHAWGIRPLAGEITVVNDRWRLAGTMDNLDVSTRDIVTPFGPIPAGDVFGGDIKTGQYRPDGNELPMFWAKYGPQVCAYVDGLPYNTDTDTRGEWPSPPNTSVAIIYNYDLKRALDGELVEWLAIPIDLAVARKGGDLSFEASRFISEHQMFAPPLATPDAFGPQIAPAASLAGDAPDDATSAAPSVERDTPAQAVAAAAGVSESANPFAGKTLDELRAISKTWQPADNSALIEHLATLGTNKRDPAAIAAAMWDVVNLHDIATTPAPRPTPAEAPTAPVQRPDVNEGATITAEAVKAAGARYLALGDDTRSWVTVTGGAIRMSGANGRPTERRRLLLMGLCELAESGFDDDGAVAAIAAHCGLGDAAYQANTAADVVAAMDVTEAAQFAAVAAVVAVTMAPFSWDNPQQRCELAEAVAA